VGIARCQGCGYKMTGQEKADSDVAKACAEGLELLVKK
jgi:hypothetical protein